MTWVLQIAVNGFGLAIWFCHCMTLMHRSGAVWWEDAVMMLEQRRAKLWNRLQNRG
jgi:hypothetical protein